MQGVGDLRDVHRSVLGHALLLLGHVHKLFGWFFLIIGPDLRNEANTDNDAALAPRKDQRLAKELTLAVTSDSKNGRND